MIGPQSQIDMLFALREREREIEAATRRAWLLAEMPDRHHSLLRAAETWLRAVAASLYQPAPEPVCCVQPA